RADHSRHRTQRGPACDGGHSPNHGLPPTRGRIYRGALVIIYGIHPVVEALRAGNVDSIRISSRGDARLGGVIDAAKNAGVAVKRVDVGELDRASKGGVHQGVVAWVQDLKPP